MKKHLALFCAVAAFVSFGCREESEEKPSFDEVVDVCGDRRVSGQEVCDTGLDVLYSCSLFDNTKAWVPGGHAICAADCLGYARGTCVESVAKPDPTPDPELRCGNNELDDEELCDGALGDLSCEKYDPTKTWNAGGQATCSRDCKSLEIGTCVEAPRCGDGIVQEGDNEECDEGANNGKPGSGCTVACRMIVN